MSAAAPSPTLASADPVSRLLATRPPYELRTVGLDDREVAVPFASETAGRVAWLTAVGVGAYRYAGLVRTSGEHRTRQRCEWSTLDTFRDVTDAHYDAIRDLLVELNRETGATSTSLATPGICSAIILDGGIRFCGPTGAHLLGDVACNTAERLRAHWRGYVPSTGATS